MQWLEGHYFPPLWSTRKTEHNWTTNFELAEVFHLTFGVHNWALDTSLGHILPVIAESNNNINSWLPKDIFYILASKMSQRVRGW